MECLTMVNDFQEAVEISLTNFSGELKISLTDANSRGLNMTIVQLMELHAMDPLKDGE